jgi:hypothetical protein
MSDNVPFIDLEPDRKWNGIPFLNLHPDNHFGMEDVDFTRGFTHEDGD